MSYAGVRKRSHSLILLQCGKQAFPVAAPPRRPRLPPAHPGAPRRRVDPAGGEECDRAYLHNGSFPTLYDLLLPPSDRPTSFYAGTREFDPVKVSRPSDRLRTAFYFVCSTLKESRSREISIPVTITTTPAYQRAIMQRSSNI
jgi:hypothetical protein